VSTILVTSSNMRPTATPGKTGGNEGIGLDMSRAGGAGASLLHRG